MWLAIEATRSIVRSRFVSVAVVETIVGIWTWLFLINRAAFSIFDQVYSWCRINRHLKREVEIPKSVKRELALAAAIGPIVEADLAAEWNPTVYMFDLCA